ncbi:MAG: ROK family protein [Bacteroidales bacterium]
MIHNQKKSDKKVAGIFLEGKHLVAGNVFAGKIGRTFKTEIDNRETEAVIIKVLINAIEDIWEKDTHAIGIGVPGLVDTIRGIAYNTINIPSWKEVHLGDVLKKHFGVSVFVNNDANCFTLGEKYFGNARKYNNIVGIISGAGLGAGIIVDNKLYSGVNCGAGEFGAVSYKDYTYEYYCTPGYFELKYGLNADKLFKRLKKDDKIAKAIIEQFGYDFGNLIKTILLSVDPEYIVIGGDIEKFFPYFEPHIWKTLDTFPFHRSLEDLKIGISDEPDIAVLGAAALCYDSWS